MLQLAQGGMYVVQTGQGTFVKDPRHEPASFLPCDKPATIDSGLPNR